MNLVKHIKSLAACRLEARGSQLRRVSIAFTLEVRRYRPRVNRAALLCTDSIFLIEPTIYGSRPTQLHGYTPKLDVNRTGMLVLLPCCNSLLYGTSEGNLNRLQSVQNQLARFVLQAPWTASATDMRRQLHWLPVRQRIIFKLAAVTYEARLSGLSA